MPLSNSTPNEVGVWAGVSYSQSNQLLLFLLKAEHYCALTEDGESPERKLKSLSGTHSAAGTNIGHPKYATMGQLCPLSRYSYISGEKNQLINNAIVFTSLTPLIDYNCA